MYKVKKYNPNQKNVLQPAYFEKCHSDIVDKLPIKCYAISWIGVVAYVHDHRIGGC